MKHYGIIEVPSDAEPIKEQLGTKPKFWWEHPELGTVLFKEAREGTGEDWSEKIAAEIAGLLQIPCASVYLAKWRDRRGILTPNFVPKRGQLHHGNELLFGTIVDYPKDEQWRVPQHTVEAAMNALARQPCLAPCRSSQASSWQEDFLGYLLLDALIGNSDRHHENWAIVRHERGQYLAPTYDHASSLGRELTDEKRLARLQTKDKNQTVQAYVERCRSGFYHDGRTVSPLAAFTKGAKHHPLIANVWLERLSQLDFSSVVSVLDKVPEASMSRPSRDFALQVIEIGHKKLLNEKQE